MPPFRTQQLPQPPLLPCRHVPSEEAAAGAGAAAPGASALDGGRLRLDRALLLHPSGLLHQPGGRRRHPRLRHHRLGDGRHHR